MILIGRHWLPACSVDTVGSTTLWLTVLPSADGGGPHAGDAPSSERRHPPVPPSRGAARGPPRSSRRPVLREEGRGIVDGPEGGGRSRRGARCRRSSRVRRRDWAVAGDLDPAAARSNTFEMEWPPRSGRVREFPEIDRVGWFDPPTARRKILPAQVPFLDRLERAIGATPEG